MERFSPAISTAPEEILFNIDLRKFSQTHLVDDILKRVELELNLKVFVDLAPHCMSVRVEKKKSDMGRFFESDGQGVTSEHVSKGAPKRPP